MNHSWSYLHTWISNSNKISIAVREKQGEFIILWKFASTKKKSLLIWHVANQMADVHFLRAATSSEASKTNKTLDTFYFHCWNNFQQPFSQEIFLEEALFDYNRNIQISSKDIFGSLPRKELFNKSLLLSKPCAENILWKFPNQL